MNTTIENLKSLRLSMTNSNDTIMHIAAILDKNMSRFLFDWGK